MVVFGQQENLGHSLREKVPPHTRSVLVLVGSLCDTALIQLIGALSGAPEATTEVKDQQSPGRTRKKSPRQRRPE